MWNYVIDEREKKIQGRHGIDSFILFMPWPQKCSVLDWEVMYNISVEVQQNF